MTTLLLDSHAIHWWTSEPERLSRSAVAAIDAADEVAVSAISWYELAWLARNERIQVTTPITNWLTEMARDIRTVSITPEIASGAVDLPSTFPRDPADRIIYSTAIQMGWRLVTKDRKLREIKQPRPITLW